MNPVPKTSFKTDRRDAVSLNDHFLLMEHTHIAFYYLNFVDALLMRNIDAA